MNPHSSKDSLTLLSAERREEAPGVEMVRLVTSGGKIDCRLHQAAPLTEDQEDTGPLNRPAAVIWVGGAGGSLNGPAGGLYVRMAEALLGVTAPTGAPAPVASLRLDYRRPNRLAACMFDTLAGAAFLKSLGYRRLILVGHSFGGAVVINAAAGEPAVIGVVTLATQTAGTGPAAELGERALLLLHGDADRVLPPSCSRDIHTRAAGPKEMILYPGCGHNFDECPAAVERDLLDWIKALLAM